MGNNHSTYEKLEIGSKCQSLKVINNEKVGDVYLVMYSEIKDGESKNEINNKKPSSFLNDIHYTIVIDVAGESNDENGIMGLEVHIVLEKNSKKIQLCFERKFGENQIYQELSMYLGKIENIYHKDQPLEWYFGLNRVILTEWFNEFIENENRGDKWSIYSNCYTFSKFLIEKFKFNNIYQLNWPH
ncbi:hypothetical protein DDB_G0282413 [Dictyostelium discoideum AX4]|uniref:Uncharacterized protein n=1 Tax=Dictyostelium discoideum TaxID=44689 RepID=Q54SK6_DICDI|nr:hypothetical protein DDB_G0282413 [Dictyostelium discoideum AX4]EAL66066.1 hypothetical protein DDB_G0282413 [Dictyostelium discoideum AX4]|eukprot:XP_640033.1 hypothetical protein DDB_G0282413 [Dictyostelium discoideum AX4]